MWYPILVTVDNTSPVRDDHSGDSNRLPERYGALRKMIEGLDVEGLIVRPHVRIGNPPRRILEFAQEGRCDLIVLGSQGRTGLGRLLMGSVAEKVVRLSDVPVFTVKGDRTSVQNGSAVRIR